MHWPQGHSIPSGYRHSLHRGERNSSGLKPTAMARAFFSWRSEAHSSGTRLLSWLRSPKLAPAVRTDRVDHDFARGRLHKLNAGRAFLVVFWGLLIFGNFVS